VSAAGAGSWAPVAAAEVLPEDGAAGTLVGRAWLPGSGDQPAGPAVVAIRPDGVYDLGAAAPTMAQLCAAPDPVRLARETAGRKIGSLDALLANSVAGAIDPARAHLLAPVDLQAIKAAGVTFARSMVERVIEERAGGDPAKAEALRRELGERIGGDLRKVKPGSPAAMELRQALIERGLWSPYLEVGIGPDAEIFTKAQPMSAVGFGADVGIHPISTWNNPEPEVVLVVAPDGRLVGATLGNDVNLRDVEGRSALLLGKAKDNNASTALGPFIRLLDDGFTLDMLRASEVSLTVAGPEGFTLEGTSSLSEISRDLLDLAGQAIGANHQYPDGFVLFTGTMFAPVKDRDAPGKGFTHREGDVVTIASPRLGRLVNRVQRSDRCPPWTFGSVALMRNLAARGLLQ
jgi:fumarylacetoacetate (FAA) hydrolase family protein